MSDLPLVGSSIIAEISLMFSDCFFLPSCKKTDVLFRDMRMGSSISVDCQMKHIDEKAVARGFAVLSVRP